METFLSFRPAPGHDRGRGRNPRACGGPFGLRATPRDEGENLARATGSTKRNAAGWALALALSLSAAPCAHAEPGPRRFPTRHPLSGPDAQQARLAWSEEDRAAWAAHPLDAQGGRFRVTLPEGYTRREGARWGLLVWLSPGERGDLPRGWAEVLAARRLVAIGPDGAGNEQPLPRRIALALDAVQGGLEAYRLDPERVYVAGFSGGGNVTCWLALHYPDVFRGALSLSGCDAHRPVPVPGRPGSFWRGTIPPPPAERLRAAQARPLLLLAGATVEQDKLQAEAVAGLLRSEGFRRVGLRIVPELGHEPPPAAELEAALSTLEAPAEDAPAPTPAPTPGD